MSLPKKITVSSRKFPHQKFSLPRKVWRVVWGNGLCLLCRSSGRIWRETRRSRREVASALGWRAPALLPDWPSATWLCHSFGGKGREKGGERGKEKREGGEGGGRERNSGLGRRRGEERGGGRGGREEAEMTWQVRDSWRVGVPRSQSSWRLFWGRLDPFWGRESSIPPPATGY